jgi:hypothetical protein
MRCALLPASLLFCTLTLLPACFDRDDECIANSGRCKHGLAVNCLGGCWLGSCNSDWEMTACEADQVCVEADDRALCALSPQPDPQCRMHSAYCGDDGRVVFCSEGYATRALDCPASGRTCSDGISYQCVESASPDPRCPTEPAQNAFCDGDLKLECNYGYLTRERECEAGCIKPEGFSHAACIHPNSAELCAPENLPTPEHIKFCVGEEQLVHCHEGLALESENCALEDRVCREGPYEGAGALCEMRSDATPP